VAFGLPFGRLFVNLCGAIPTVGLPAGFLLADWGLPRWDRRTAHCTVDHVARASAVVRVWLSLSGGWRFDLAFGKSIR
jgi:hypothetical protein